MILTDVQLLELFLDYEDDFTPIEAGDYNGVPDPIGVSLYIDNDQHYIHLELYHTVLEVQIYYVEDEVELTMKNYDFISRYLDKKIEDFKKYYI